MRIEWDAALLSAVISILIGSFGTNTFFLMQCKLKPILIWFFALFVGFKINI